jgi:hypothetical protein
MKTIKEPKLLYDYPCNEMALNVFVMACSEWNKEHKNYNYMVSIKDLYFDIGQQWMYTALITTDTKTEEHWQSLCPRDWKLVVNCMDIEKIIEMANYYMDTVKNKENVKLYSKFE